MKIRLDFVTNSSSSSFIVAFSNKKDMEQAKEEMLKIYSYQIVERIFSDILSNKVTYTEARKEFKESVEDRCYYYLHYSLRSPYRNKPNDWFESKEYKKLEKEMIKEELAKFDNMCSHRGFFSIVNYSDNTSEGSMLEHDIMPNQSFVLRVLNYH